MTGANNKACLNCPMAAPALKAAKAVLERSNEITSYPWWFICNTPRSSVRPDIIPLRIIGPFFSREEAEREIQARNYNYHRKAFVFCGSGHVADTYKTAVDAAARLIGESRDHE
jgi:hypothetical protein